MNNTVIVTETPQARIIISSPGPQGPPGAGGGGGGAVDSVNGQTGVVVLDTGDIADVTDKRYITDAQQTVLGNTSGTNTGNQTSIVGISGTLAQFNTALSDADFATGGGVVTGTSSGTNTGDQSLAGLQPLDADLTAIAALTPSNDDVIQRKSGAWTNRTMAQVKTDLALTKSDVGLGSVVNADTTTTANITDSLNKRFVTDADLTDIGNLSGTNTGDQSLFRTIAVSGQSDVVADSTTDTLTLVAGSNITITTDATTDSITIASSGGGGGGGGAPTGAEYVTLSTNGSLTHERVLTAGTGISITDAGAGSTVTLAVDPSISIINALIYG
jgi:hypothetical protein